jgi:hypothetical protein
MQASRLPNTLKAFILNQSADGIPSAEIYRMTGIHRADLLPQEEEIQ